MNTNYNDLSPVLQEHCQDVISIAMALMPFHEKREDTYQLSFAKRGETGVWMNLMRKTDRLDRLCEKVFSGEEGNNGVTLVDTLVDTAMYALKWLAVIKQIRPEDMEIWVREVFCKETCVDYDAAVEMFGIRDNEGAAGVFIAYNSITPTMQHFNGKKEQEDPDAQRSNGSTEPDPKELKTIYKDPLWPVDDEEAEDET